jgi:predicted Rossmann fold nucleotide-binding protein DprA/Smf involved in DNA uptake
VTQPVSFAPNQLIKQGAKLVTSAEDVIEELPTPVRACSGGKTRIRTAQSTGSRVAERDRKKTL